MSIVRDADGSPEPKLDAAGKPVPFKIAYPAKDEKGNFLTPPQRRFGGRDPQLRLDVRAGHRRDSDSGGIRIGDRRWAARPRTPNATFPIAVITSLLVQGVFCYLIEYFAANYFLNSGYTMQTASGSAAPIGDMMIMVGDALFGPGSGRIFMLVEAFTVFLAIIGTTLSCMNTGARVTYAMGKDEEVPEHFGMLHSKNLTPHRAIWTLAIDLGRHRLHRGVDAVRRCRRSHGRRHQGAAAGLLVQLRLHHARRDGGAAQYAC